MKADTLVHAASALTQARDALLAGLKGTVTKQQIEEAVQGCEAAAAELTRAAGEVDVPVDNAAFRVADDKPQKAPRASRKAVNSVKELTEESAAVHAALLREIRTAGRLAREKDEESAEERAGRYARGKAELDAVFRKAVKAGKWTQAQLDAFDQAHRERAKAFVPADEKPVPLGAGGTPGNATLRRGFEARLQEAGDVAELDGVLDEATEHLWNDEDREAINRVYGQRKEELAASV